MTPETRGAFIIDYMDGDLTDDLLAAKYGLTIEQVKVAAHIGTGSIITPEPLARRLKRGMRNTGAVSELANKYLTPEDMALSPLQSAEVITPESRDAALYLNIPELEFANNVLRGMKPHAAAAASFEIYNAHLAQKKAGELLRTSHIADYLASMRGRSLFAPVRNKAYLEAVLWQIVDRSMELSQVFNPLTGQPVPGKCSFDPKAATAALTLLAKIKGYDGNDKDDASAETQRDRLRRLTQEKRHE